MAAKRTHIQFVEELTQRNKRNPEYPIGIQKNSTYVSLDAEMVFVCLRGHPDFLTRPRYILQKNSGCPLCGSQKAGNTNTKSHELFLQELAQSSYSLSVNQSYGGTYCKLQFECKYGHTFITYPKTVLAGHGCPICVNIQRRKTRQVNYSEYVVPDVALQEFDTIINMIQNIHIELIPISQPYDKYKYINQQLALAQQTIFVFEDEWLNNKTLIKSKLMHYSHVNDVQRIHARQCLIKEISTQQKRILLEQNHVQGDDNSQIRYGAFYDDRLIALMTFTAPRLAVGAKSKNREQYTGQWELSRFCTDINYRIPGIAGKLLKHFQRNHTWKEIYSFADRRWSTGELYHSLGFSLKSTNPPSYYYIVNGKRKHRWNYRKDILKDTLPNYDPSKTEYENMQAHGFYRVWDCGTLKFVMKNNIS